jgi:hypothetical protein
MRVDNPDKSDKPDNPEIQEQTQGKREQNQVGAVSPDVHPDALPDVCPPLHFSDLQKLLAVSQGQRPTWGNESKDRCKTLITPTGNFLTKTGERKVNRIKAILVELRRGIPLHIERANRSDELGDEAWFKTKWDQAHCWFGDSALFSGKPPKGLEYQALQPDDPKVAKLQREILEALDTRSLLKLIPIAVQRNQLDGLEVATLIGATKQVLTARIQTRYFDWVSTYWADPTWWHYRSDNGTTFVVAQSATGKNLDEQQGANAHRYRLSNHVVAIIVPVSNEGWYTPDSDIIDNVGIGDESGVELWRDRKRRDDAVVAEKQAETAAASRLERVKDSRLRGRATRRQIVARRSRRS